MKKTLIRIAVLCAMLEPFLPNISYADGLHFQLAAAFPCVEARGYAVE